VAQLTDGTVSLCRAKASTAQLINGIDVHCQSKAQWHSATLQSHGLNGTADEWHSAALQDQGHHAVKARQSLWLAAKHLWSATRLRLPSFSN